VGREGARSLASLRSPPPLLCPSVFCSHGYFLPSLLRMFGFLSSASGRPARLGGGVRRRGSGERALVAGRWQLGTLACLVGRGEVKVRVSSPRLFVSGFWESSKTPDASATLKLDICAVLRCHATRPFPLEFIETTPFEPFGNRKNAYLTPPCPPLVMLSRAFFLCSRTQRQPKEAIPCCRCVGPRRLKIKNETV